MPVAVFRSPLAMLLLLCSCGESPRYEFHTGYEGKILWRIDKRTGEAWCSIVGKPWQPVTDQEPPLPATLTVDRARQQAFARAINEGLPALDEEWRRDIEKRLGEQPGATKPPK